MIRINCSGGGMDAAVTNALAGILRSKNPDLKNHHG
jgi:hypothetical protein